MRKQENFNWKPRYKRRCLRCCSQGSRQHYPSRGPTWCRSDQIYSGCTPYTMVCHQGKTNQRGGKHIQWYPHNCNRAWWRNCRTRICQRCRNGQRLRADRIGREAQFGSLGWGRCSRWCLLRHSRGRRLRGPSLLCWWCRSGQWLSQWGYMHGRAEQLCGGWGRLGAGVEEGVAAVAAVGKEKEVQLEDKPKCRPNIIVNSCKSSDLTEESLPVSEREDSNTPVKDRSKQRQKMKVNACKRVRGEKGLHNRQRWRKEGWTRGLRWLKWTSFCLCISL